MGSVAVRPRHNSRKQTHRYLPYTDKKTEPCKVSGPRQGHCEHEEELGFKPGKEHTSLASKQPRNSQIGLIFIFLREREK